MRSRIRRIRQEARDLIEVVILPGVAAILPWWLCFRLFKWLARREFLYREACERALHEASARGWAVDGPSWIAERRLVTLVDHADHYLSRTRSDAWMKRYLVVKGHWPAPKEASLQLTFHWGAGMWALRHAHSAGLKAHMLVAAVNGEHFKNRSVLHRYIRARTKSISMALGRPTVDVSVSLRPVLRALRGNEQVIAVIDVPADQVGASQPINLLGMSARIPTALLRVAVENATPVTVFLTGINLHDGQRFLHLTELGIYENLDQLIDAVFKILAAAITDDPAAWHFWGEAKRFFST